MTSSAKHNSSVRHALCFGRDSIIRREQAQRNYCFIADYTQPFRPAKSLCSRLNENGYNRCRRRDSLSFDEKEIPLLSETEPSRSEPRGFTHEQMVTCDVCLRANPPTRTSCLYCAAQLPATSVNASLQRPTLRKLENWEQGFNTIFLPDSARSLNENVLEEMEQSLRLKKEDLKRIVETNAPLPLCRAATRDEASLIERRLAEMGVNVIVVADSDFTPNDSVTRRARALELNDSELVLYQAGGSGLWRMAWDEIALLVVGRLFVRRIEVEERKSRKTEKEIVNAREMSEDESVIDIYTAQANTAWRISAGSFDFSCLGALKGLLAVQNFSTLIGILRERASQARYHDSYLRVRHALAIVWPLEQNTEAGGRRRRTGRINTEAVTKSDNEIQFTRYSRLQYYLKLRYPELSA